MHRLSPRILILLMAVVAAGCGDSPKPADADAASQSASGSSTGRTPDKVTLALNWFPEAEHGGFYAAQVHGYFRDAGLEVTILPGGRNAPVLQRLDRESIDFGVENADRVLLARAAGAEVTALMAPLQVSPRCIMVHEASGITSLEGLRDVTLAMNSGATWAQFLQQSLPLENVRIVDGASVAKFLTDPDYAQQGYVFSEPFVAQSQGGDPRALLVADLGFNPYTSLLVTRSSTISDQPDLIRRMVEASVRGWRKYLEEPERTNAEIHRLNPEMSEEILAFGAEAMRPLCVTEQVPAEQLGTMTAERWQTLHDQLVELDVYAPDAVSPQKAFDSSFLPAVPAVDNSATSAENSDP